jgi:hypothetical protein
MAIHWGVFKYLRTELNAKAWVLLTALILDAVVLGAFLYLKLTTDPLVVAVSAGGMALIFGAEWWFLRRKDSSDDESE